MTEHLQQIEVSLRRKTGLVACLLRFIEKDSQMGRAVVVLKMRDSDHERGLRQYQIDGDGITVGDKLEDLSGLLGWSALREETPPSA